eukprot:COSAG02_NODE_1744_length_11100_cov_6.084083_7_plen_92_part_00
MAAYLCGRLGSGRRRRAVVLWLWGLWGSEGCCALCAGQPASQSSPPSPQNIQIVRDSLATVGDRSPRGGTVPQFIHVHQTPTLEDVKFSLP